MSWVGSGQINRFNADMVGSCSHGKYANVVDNAIHLGPVWFEMRERKRVERNRVDLTKNSLILNRLYFPSLSFNPSRPLSGTNLVVALCEHETWGLACGFSGLLLIEIL